MGRMREGRWGRAAGGKKGDGGADGERGRAREIAEAASNTAEWRKNCRAAKVFPARVQVGNGEGEGPGEGKEKGRQEMQDVDGNIDGVDGRSDRGAGKGAVAILGGRTNVVDKGGSSGQGRGRRL
eukprot:scaffold9314_cov81-Amphora_coffeaeformis.AAC.1